MKLLFDQNLSFRLCRALAIAEFLREHHEAIAAFGADADAAVLELY